jgi:hypothetical protein
VALPQGTKSWIVAALALGLCGVLGYGWLDRAYAADDAYTEVNRLDQRSVQALMVVNHDWIGRPSTDVDAFARRMKAEGWLVKREGSDVGVDDLVFRIKDGRVARVDYNDMPGCGERPC